MEQPITLEQLKADFEADPGDPRFVQYAQGLVYAGQNLEAMLVCLKGLSVNANCDEGRLFLAELFFEQGFTSFAAREIEELCRREPENETLARLLAKLQPEAAIAPTVQNDGPKEGEELAEQEFSMDDLEALGDDQA